jgi:hypothetical protein
MALLTCRNAAGFDRQLWWSAFALIFHQPATPQTVQNRITKVAGGTGVTVAHSWVNGVGMSKFAQRSFADGTDVAGTTGTHRLAHWRAAVQTVTKLTGETFIARWTDARLGGDVELAAIVALIEFVAQLAPVGSVTLTLSDTAAKTVLIDGRAVGEVTLVGVTVGRGYASIAVGIGHLPVVTLQQLAVGTAEETHTRTCAVSLQGAAVETAFGRVAKRTRKEVVAEADRLATAVVTDAILTAVERFTGVAYERSGTLADAV